MLVEKPPKWLFRLTFFFVKSARFSAYGLGFTYSTMRCCFFRQFAFRFREKRSQNIEESLNDVQWSETKEMIISICTRASLRVTWHSWLECVPVREIPFRVSVQILNFFPCFFFFCFLFFTRLFIIFLLTGKTYYYHYCLNKNNRLGLILQIYKGKTMC